MKLTQTTGPVIGGQKPKGGKNSTFLEAWKKEISNTINFFKKWKDRNTAQMKEQTRNTEVQINEEEIGKLPEKGFKIMIVKMIKKQANKQKLSTSLTLYKAYPNHWTNLRGQKPKGRKSSTLKPGKRRPQKQ